MRCIVAERYDRMGCIDILYVDMETLLHCTTANPGSSGMDFTFWLGRVVCYL
jgi:hypothetical protein